MSGETYLPDGSMAIPEVTVSGSETSPTGPAAAPAASPAVPSEFSADRDEVLLIVDDKVYGGWSAVRVTRGIERMPSDFDLQVTDPFPDDASKLVLKPGAPCRVQFGNDKVVTGYIDRYVPSIGPRQHSVRITGRGKCQDLVDCSAGVLKDGTFRTQINAQTAQGIATDLAAPFDITVSLYDAEAHATIPQFVITLSETPFDIIERVARYQQLLAYEGADGNLILARAGTDKMASGVAEGANIELGSATFAGDQRYSDYIVVWNSTDALRQEREAVPGGQQGNQHGLVKDDTVLRFRPRIIVSEQLDQGRDIGQQRAAWEMNRRNGRSQVCTVTVDSWRDSAGALWEPNRLLVITAPHLKLDGFTWLIGEVTYRRGRDGTHADLLLMSPNAYKPEPTALQGTDYQVFQALQQGGGGAQQE